MAWRASVTMSVAAPLSEPLGQPVVRLVPADLIGEVPTVGRAVDDQQLNAEQVGKVDKLLSVHRSREHRMVWTTGGDPGLCRRRQVWLRLPHRPGDRQFGQRFVRLNYGDLIQYQPEPITKITNADHNGRTRFGVEYQTYRILPVANAQGMNFDPRFAGSDARADLEHVGTQDLRRARPPVIGVILHE